MKIFFTATAESVYNLGNMWYHWQLVSVTECGAGWPDRLAWTGHTQFEGTAPTTHLIHKLMLRYKLQGKWTQGVHKVQLFLLLFQLPGNCRLWAINLQLSTPRTQGLLNTDRKVVMLKYDVICRYKCTRMSGCSAARNSEAGMRRTLRTHWSFRSSKERTVAAEETSK